MSYKLIGMRRFQYKKKNTGELVDACELYVTYEARKDVVGTPCEVIFVKSEFVPKELKLDDTIQVFYNRFRSVERVEIVKF